MTVVAFEGVFVTFCDVVVLELEEMLLVEFPPTMRYADVWPLVPVV